MPPVPPEVDLDLYRRGRRAVWTLYAVTMLVAAVFYYYKADDGRSAFVRWGHQVPELWSGENIFDKYMFPNPPIVPMLLAPFMALPPVGGAMAWFAFKVALTAIAAELCFRMTRPAGGHFPAWAQLIALVLSIRPIFSDLQHGNINLVILFLIVAMLWAWRKGYDVLAGLILALAISMKVTPALFVPYFLYKRSWRTVGATMLGMGVFLLVLPSLVLGPQFNGECLAMWYHRILRPYVASAHTGSLEINQSLPGVLQRLLADLMPTGRYDPHIDVSLTNLDPEFVTTIAKVLSVGLLGLLGLFCRTRAPRRDDARMLGEFALVVLTMLFVSERSWKHHFVTLILPYSYLVYRAVVAPESRRIGAILIGVLAASTVMIATTSTDLADAIAKDAQAYGLFLWGSMILYAATAWRVVVEGRRPTDTPVAAALRALPAPHLRPSADPATPADAGGNEARG